jgi:hypothetical protein
MLSNPESPKEYYLYFYLREDNTPYYVGKGKGRRAWNKNNHITQPPTELSRIIIAEDGLSEIGALALERRYIHWYGRKDLGTGILRNRTNGGDGVSGRKTTTPRSAESRNKTSRSLLGKNIGQKRSIEQRQKMSLGQTGLKRPQTVESINKRLKTIAEKGPEFYKESNLRKSEKLRGRKLPTRTAEHSAKLAKSKAGKKQSPETIAKRAEGMRQYHAKRKMELNER